jgi:hypothetical protein
VDVLSVNLDVNDAGATVKFNNFTQAAERTAAGVNAAGQRINFGASVAAELDQLTHKIRSSDSAVTALTSRYGKLAPTIAAAREEQERLNRSAAALALIQGRSTGANGPLTAEQRYSRFNLARQGGDVFTSAAMGMSPAMIAIQQGPQIMEAMATAGGKFSTAMTAAKGAIVAFGPAIAIGAAGAAIVYKITSDIRSEAERRLAVEERIAKAYGEQNKRVIELKQSLREALQEQDRGFSDDRRRSELERYSPEQLAAREADIRKRLEAGPTFDPNSYDPNKGFKSTGEYERLQQELLLVRQLQNERAKLSAAGPDRFFAQSTELWKKQQEAAVKAQEAFNVSVKEGLELSKEYGATWTGVFNDLSVRTNAANPIAAFLQRSSSEAEKLKEAIKGLPPEMQKTAIAIKAVADARDLFNLRLDNAIGSYNLLTSAADIRNAGKFQEERYRRDFLYNNPNFAFLKEQEYAARQRDSRDPLSYNGQSFDEFLKDEIEKRNPNSERGRLNRRLDDLFNLTGGAASADGNRKFLSASQGVDPLKLDDRNRERLAQANENEAARMEAYNTEAQKLRAQQAGYLKNISDHVDKLKLQAEKGGKTAVEVPLKNDSGDPIDVKIPTQADTDRDYAGGFAGFELLGGTNR